MGVQYCSEKVGLVVGTKGASRKTVSGTYEGTVRLDMMELVRYYLRLRCLVLDCMDEMDRRHVSKSKRAGRDRRGGTSTV